MKPLKLLMFVIMAVMLVSCTQAQSEEFVPAYEGDSEYTGFDGYVFRIMQEPETVNTFYYEQDTVFWDILNQKINKLEQDFDCTIEVSQMGGS